MFEYKLEKYKVAEAEKEMNILAKQGWRVNAVSYDTMKGGIIVSYERKVI